MSSLSAADEQPWIFLSHSGQQKDFVTHLYYALLHAKQRPFFDKDSKDSLPSGLDYPTRIFEVCRECKIGVVVLTEHYVTSLWPMLELQHLLLGPADRPIYPLFYRLKPADLSDSANLKRWEEHWQQEAPAWQSRMQKLQEHMASSSNGSCRIKINLNIASWRHNLEVLQYRSGEVCNVFHVNPERSFYESDYKYIHEIVDNICARLPPHMKYLLDVGVVGEKRMQQEINQVFEEEGSMGDDGVRVIGVYGIGGSGKSTLCKMMLNFYCNQFPGRCFFLELPTPGEGGIGKDEKILLKRIKAVLKADHISDIDQAMKDLQEGLLRKEAFLAIDNVWNSNLDFARRLMFIKFVPGTKIMITSRSKEIVSRLLLPQSRHDNEEVYVGDGQFPSRIHRHVVHVPSLGESEAVQALKRHSPCASFIPEEDLRKLARSCFFEEQCHPLYLKLKGSQLEQKGHPSFLQQQWSNLISSLINVHEESFEDVVMRAVEKSFEALPSSRLQDIFIYLVTFQSSEVYLYSLEHVEYFVPVFKYFAPLCSLLDFVRLHYDDFTEDEMFSAALELQYHGLLVLELEFPEPEISLSNRWKVIIHDLHKLVVANRRVAHADALVKSSILDEISSCGRTMMRSKHATICPDLVQVQARFLRICGTGPFSKEIFSRFSIFNNSSLNLRNESRNLEALRFLTLKECEDVQEIAGWIGVPNLALLVLYEMAGLRRIEPMGCLQKLERLRLHTCSDLDIHSLVGGAEDGGSRRSLFKDGDCLPRLQDIEIIDNDNLAEVGALSDACPALTNLTLTLCKNLRRVEGSFSSLKHLFLGHDGKLEGIPDVVAGSLTTLISATFPVCKQSAHSSQSAHANNKRIRYQSGGPATFSVLSLVTGLVFHSSALSVGHPQSSSVPELSFINAPRLRALSLICADFESPDVCGLHISDMPSLEYLNLMGFASVQKLTFENSTVKLKKNYLKNLVSLEEISGLKACHGKLETITIRDCPSLARFLDANSKNSLPALTHLRLGGCSSFTDVSYLAGLATLTSLSLIECTSLTDVSGVSDLASLAKLCLSTCTSLTNVSGVSSLASLARLDLSGCTSLTDVSGVSGLASLTELDLSLCTSIIDVSSLSGLASLTELDLSQCTSIIDVSSLSGLPSLTELNLSQCTSIIDVSSVSSLRSLTKPRLICCNPKGI